MLESGTLHPDKTLKVFVRCVCCVVIGDQALSHVTTVLMQDRSIVRLIDGFRLVHIRIDLTLNLVSRSRLGLVGVETVEER